MNMVVDSFRSTLRAGNFRKSFQGPPLLRDPWWSVIPWEFWPGSIFWGVGWCIGWPIERYILHSLLCVEKRCFFRWPKTQLLNLHTMRQLLQSWRVRIPRHFHLQVGSVLDSYGGGVGGGNHEKPVKLWEWPLFTFSYPTVRVFMQDQIRQFDMRI